MALTLFVGGLYSEGLIFRGHFVLVSRGHFLGGAYIRDLTVFPVFVYRKKNLLLKWILYTPGLQETNIKFTVNKKIRQSENDN